MIRSTITKFITTRGAAVGVIVGAILLVGQLGSRVLASPAGAGAHPFSTDRMVAHMTWKLGLSDTQAEQVKQVLDSRQTQIKAQFQTLKSARQALRQATLASPVDEGAIRAAAQTLAQAEGDAAFLRAQIHAQIVPLLTPDQQQKLSAFAAQPHGSWTRHGRGAID